MSTDSATDKLEYLNGMLDGQKFVTNNSFVDETGKHNVLGTNWPKKFICRANYWSKGFSEGVGVGLSMLNFPKLYTNK